MPPPSAPSEMIWPFRRMPPTWYGGSVIGRNSEMKLNVWPGFTTVSLMRRAGVLMFAPLPFDGPGTNRVRQRPSRTIPGTGGGEGDAVGDGEAVGLAVGDAVGVAVGDAVGEA